jgi:hypothetical protein
LGPEGTGTGESSDFPGCSLSSGVSGRSFTGLVGGARACGPVRPPYRVRFPRGCVRGLVLVVVVGWCPFVF